MLALIGLHKDRHGTYHARKKVPPQLQEAVALVLQNNKNRQVWLKRSLGTKDLDKANVHAKPVLMEFNRILARAHAQACLRIRAGQQEARYAGVAGLPWPPQHSAYSAVH